MSPDSQAGDGTIEETAAGLRFLLLPPDEIIDPEALAAGLKGAAPDAVAPFLREALDGGRSRIREEFARRPAAGLRTARAYAHLVDEIIRALHHHIVTEVHPAPIRTSGEQLAVVAVGGCGRGEMAPFSDVDLLFLTPYKTPPWVENVVETMLHTLWDLRLKVGWATRTISDCIRLAGEDITIRTALLEQRYIAGDREPYEELGPRLWEELFEKTGLQFVEAKLEERDRRHKRNGGSRYVLEPNVKEGKGGIRDLQTLHWISKYLYRTETAWDLVGMGVFQHDEVQTFAEASKFLWAVRCHLHDLAGRAQEQLTFDRQVEIAERMGFRDGAGRRAVEHFMHTYFRHAKNVGDLTRIFSAALEAQHQKAKPGFALLRRAFGRGGTAGEGPFIERAGRIDFRDPSVIEEDPVNMLRLFREAARSSSHVHPNGLRLVTQNLHLVDDAMRTDPVANELFLEMICDLKNAEWVLRRMNETNLLGTFVPEFGRIVAMMQFNMYHHYTVDEHTIRTIGIACKIEQLEESERHPVATDIVKHGVNTKVLHTALLLHDIGKGTERDHSEWGAEIAAVVCPRLGLDDSETDLVVWLVRHHLLMSDTAQKRDITDPGTVRDFAEVVKSPERLRLLLILTVCDIRGVGPDVWNNWKAQLLRNLYWDTRDHLTAGHGPTTRAAMVEEAKEALRERLKAWPEGEVEAAIGRMPVPYWLGLDPETHALHAEMAKHSAEQPFQCRFLAQESRDATMAVLYMADHPGIFARMAGAFAIAGASVVDARTYTSSDGMAASAFWIQDRNGAPFDPTRLDRLGKTIERILGGEMIAREAIAERRRPKAREESFTVPTRIVFDNDSSDLFTVIEVNARDRLGLLYELTSALSRMAINISSAIITTYGAHAVDVFYVKDIFGHKIRSRSKLAKIEAALRDAVDRHAVRDTAR